MTESLFTPESFAELYQASLSAPLPGISAEPERYSDPALIERLRRIAELLRAHGKSYNLTSLLEPEEIVRLHLLDSLIPLALLREAGLSFDSLLDVGTGAGFPLLPMACAMADSGVRFTALDATAKKIAHVRESAEAAGLPNVVCLAARAEEAARTDLREAFAAVTARAVAPLPILLELCAPFVKPGGFFCALKAHAEAELADSGRAAEKLGLGAVRQIGYELPGGDARCLLIYEKIRSTPPRFPRRYAEIKKQPLK